MLLKKIIIIFVKNITRLYFILSFRSEGTVYTVEGFRGSDPVEIFSKITVPT